MATKKLEVVIAGDGKGAAGAFGDVESAAGGMEGKLSGLGGKIAPLALGAGVAAGAALVAGFNEAMNDASIVTQFQNELGVSPEVAAQMGKATSSAYADGFGQSKGELAAAAAAINTAFGDSISYDPEVLQPLIAQADALAQTFDVDVSEAMLSAESLLTNGLVGSGQEALDLLASGLQGLAPAVREEILAATAEYGKHFDALGISGEEMFAIFRAADGVIGVDKLGDAMKELTIRGTDMSATSVAAFDSMGLSAQDMSNSLLAGGDDARGAMDKIVDGLLGIEDPTAQANAAIALFGTPLEDLGTDKIPQFLSSLQGMDAGLGDITGSAQDMADGINSGPAATIERFKRTVLQGLADFIGGTLIPGIQSLVAVFQADGLSGVFTKIGEAWANAWPTIQTTLSTFALSVGTWITEQVPIIAAKIAEWGRALIEWVLPQIPPLLEQLGQALGALGSWIIDTGLPLLVAKIREWGVAFVGWIAPQIPPMLAQLAELGARLYAWLYTEALPKIVSTLQEWAKAFAAWIVEDALPGLAAELPKINAAITEWFTGVAIPAAKEKAGELVDAILQWFKDLPGKILDAIGDLSRILFNAGKDIIQGLLDGIGSMIGSLSRKFGEITSMIPDLKGPAVVDRVLLQPAGQMIMGGLIAGIDDGEGLLRKKLTDVTGLVRSVGDGSLSIPSGMPAPSGGGTTVVNITVSGSVLSERELVGTVIDGIEKARRVNGGRALVVT